METKKRTILPANAYEAEFHCAGMKQGEKVTGKLKGIYNTIDYGQREAIKLFSKLYGCELSSVKCHKYEVLRVMEGAPNTVLDLSDKKDETFDEYFK